MSVEDIYAPDRSPGMGMPCGRLGIFRETVDGKYDVVEIASYGIPCP